MWKRLRNPSLDALMHIENAGKDRLIPARRLAGDVREQKLKSRFVSYGQNVQRLAGYAALGVHVHQARVGGAYASIAYGYGLSNQ